MSLTLVLGIFVALVATAHCQCINPGFGCPGGDGGDGWLQQLQQARARALAQQLASEMSAEDSQRTICGCCCAETPCISDPGCTCSMRDCYDDILEIAATMNEGNEMMFSAQTLTEALKMQRAEQQAEIAVQELAQAQSMGPWPSRPWPFSQHG